MDRREKLVKMLNETQSEVVTPLVDKLLFLENQLDELEKLPMIKINPENPSQQKTTPAAKLYKEFLQQYTNVIKIIARITGEDGETETSPLREWVKMRSG